MVYTGGFFFTKSKLINPITCISFIKVLDKFATQNISPLIFL